MLNSLENAVDCRERRTHFMGNIHHKLAPQILLAFDFLIGGFQRPCHLVEILRQLIKLIFVMILQ